MRPSTRPIFLLADSQLLFWNVGEARFLASIRDAHLPDAPRAAYIGASNGDVPEYYAIFEAAMHDIGIGDCRMIRSTLSSSDRAFLSDAHIVMLAGGDVDRGWRVLVETGMRDAIVERHRAGATLIGISAGAVQLGLHGVRERDGSPGELFDTFGLCPFVVIAHDEERDWSEAARAARLLDGTARGIGIPFGGGVTYHPDGRVEAVRRPAHDFRFERGAVTRHLLIPAGGDVTSLA